MKYVYCKLCGSKLGGTPHIPGLFTGRIEDLSDHPAQVVAVIVLGQQAVHENICGENLLRLLLTPATTLVWLSREAGESSDMMSRRAFFL